MIKFNGKEFTELFPVKIDDIVITPIEINAVARQRAIQFGAEFVRISGGTRTVTITFALLDSDIDNREQVMNDIREWCSIGAEYTLELPQYPTRHLECAVTQMPDYSYRKWWENKLRIVFTCFNNPYWTSNELIEVPCGTSFSIGGTAPPLMTIERNGTNALANQVFSNGTASMTFAQIPAGKMTIDLSRQTAAIGKTSIMKYYKPNSKWIVPAVGANQKITGVGTIKYRERWV